MESPEQRSRGNLAGLKRALDLRMPTHPWPGTLITVCGLDGSGKTTAAAIVTELVAAKARQTELVKIPSEWARGHPGFATYSADHSTASRGIVDLLSICLMCDADVLAMTRSRIDAALQKGYVVVTDRYVFSSLAELSAQGRPQEEIDVVRSLHGMLWQPDLGLVTLVPADVAIARVRSRPDEADAVMDIELWRRMADEFREVVAQNSFLIGLDTVSGTDQLSRQLEHLVATALRM